MPPREALQKSFDELDIFNERSRYNIVSRFLESPYVTTMDSFAKMTQYVTGVSGPSQNYHLYSSDAEDFQQPDSFTELEISEHGGEPGFEVVVRTLPKRPDVKRSDPLGHIEWALSYDNEGRVMHEQELRERIFRGGVEPELRKEVWTFLLDYYSFESTYKEREARRKSLKDDYYRMKLQWKSFSEDQESRFADFRERKNLVEKDVSRTDRAHAFFQGENNSNVEMLYDILMTYCMYNFDLGYVQGMSDLLSPILIVMENEADAFWCFVGFLKRVSSNFDLDQSGMKEQLSQLYDILSLAVPKLAIYLDEQESGNLYFCFRWLLVLFKREFKCEEIMRLWEVLWSGLPCKNFHLLICIAILDNEKDLLIENNYGLNEILKHINDMSYQIDLDKSLSTAEAIYQQLLGLAKLPDSVRLALDIPLGTADPTQNGNGPAEQTEFLTPEHLSPVEPLTMSSPEVADRSRSGSGRSAGRTTSSSSNSVEVIPDRDGDVEAHYERHFDMIN
ncbi:rabGAP domain-containing protein, putative [Ixodes scapularis]|uniref:TBC1 domain family member 15 n=2 Tax=Ixodes scapularis TaxID=6945 RepID=B7PAD8_IXOSC|nr:rabGAP domain-containing protein, putative [Ixodes scapularis]|eukprot:XP_002406773.1 rabGAP domain-containing protein, putative [Ixodes scapularis]